MINLVIDMESYAIVGASNNKEKYGYKVMLSLQELGFEVIPINPHEKKILGEKAYSSIKDLNEIVDVVVLIVPPKVSEKIVEEVNEKGIEKVWFQPGSESEKAIRYCKENGIEVISGKCIMVTKGNIK